MRRVIVESPYAGANWADPNDRNLRYLRACMRDCVLRDETPYASHGLLTQPGVLRDEVPEERNKGIQAGFAWRGAADATVVYTDLGYSNGMRHGITHAESLKEHAIEYRHLGGEWSQQCGAV
jgi:hypothetical protein